MALPGEDGSGTAGVAMSSAQMLLTQASAAAQVIASLAATVRELVEACRRRGVRTLVDGAHALGQVRVDVRDIGCDFYAANAHKWLYR